MNYGLPYMGSKNRIAQKIVDVLPKAHTFVDLFCGGCAVTHAAMLSGKYSSFIANDLDGAMPRLFLNCIDGKFKDENRWISREDFKRMKKDDAYIRSVWSFGNNGDGYMYSKEVEPWKKALHYARFFGNFSLLREFDIESDGSRADIVAHHDEYKKKYVAWYVENVIGKNFDERLVKDLQSLQRLQRLQSLQRLEVHGGDYRDVEIPSDSVVYCDIPYRGTAEYVAGAFDYDAFYEWALSRPFPVYISEYSMPSEFTEVWSVPHRSILSGAAKNAVTERLFCNRAQARLGQLVLFTEAV